MNLPRDDKLTSLASRAIDGDEDALAELVAELQPEVVRVARLVVGAGSWAAEDAAQEAMLDFTVGIRGLKNPGAVRPWALRIATNRALKVAQLERLRLAKRSLVEVPEPAAGQPDLSMGELRAAFYRLPPRQRAVAVLRLFSGLSEAETAATLGCSLGTVKSNLHDARQALMQALGPTRSSAPINGRRSSEVAP